MARRGSPSTRVGEAATRFQGAGAASCSVELTTGLRFLRLGMVFAGRVKRYPIGLTLRLRCSAVVLSDFGGRG